MTSNIKEKVLKRDYRIEVLRKLIEIEKTKQEGTTITLDYINWLETKLRLLLSSEKNLLAEVKKVIDELPRWNEAILGGKPAMKFKPKGDFIKYYELKQKLGIK